MLIDCRVIRGEWPRQCRGVTVAFAPDHPFHIGLSHSRNYDVMPPRYP